MTITAKSVQLLSSIALPSQTSKTGNDLHIVKFSTLEKKRGKGEGLSNVVLNTVTHLARHGRLIRHRPGNLHSSACGRAQGRGWDAWHRQGQRREPGLCGPGRHLGDPRPRAPRLRGRIRRGRQGARRCRRAGQQCRVLVSCGHRRYEVGFLTPLFPFYVSWRVKQKKKLLCKGLGLMRTSGAM